MKTKKKLSLAVLGLLFSLQSFAVLCTTSPKMPGGIDNPYTSYVNLKINNNTQHQPVIYALGDNAQYTGSWYGNHDFPQSYQFQIGSSVVQNTGVVTSQQISDSAQFNLNIPGCGENYNGYDKTATRIWGLDGATIYLETGGGFYYNFMRNSNYTTVPANCASITVFAPPPNNGMTYVNNASNCPKYGNATPYAVGPLCISVTDNPGSCNGSTVSVTVDIMEQPNDAGLDGFRTTPANPNS